VLFSAQSNLTNKSRLKLLQRREEQLQELFSIARTSILTFAEDEGRYSQFLEGAVVQGFLQLMETRVTLHVRGQDADIMQKAGEAAADSYAQISGREVSFELETTLSEDW
jgi:V-type H+-transporting ATPase subunit E